MSYIGSIGDAAEERDRKDEAIRGFCQDQAAHNFRWRADYCQSQVNTALGVPLQQAAISAPQLPYLAVPRVVRTEVELLREELAAMKALVEALTPPPAAPVPNPLARAVARWPGSQGFIQGIRWRGV